MDSVINDDELRFFDLTGRSGDTLGRTGELFNLFFPICPLAVTTGSEDSAASQGGAYSFSNTAGTSSEGYSKANTLSTLDTELFSFISWFKSMSRSKTRKATVKCVFGFRQFESTP